MNKLLTLEAKEMAQWERVSLLLLCLATLLQSRAPWALLPQIGTSQPGRGMCLSSAVLRPLLGDPVLLGSGLGGMGSCLLGHTA